MGVSDLPDGYSIRALRIEDAKAMAAAVVRNREHLARWDPVRGEEYYTVDGQEDAIARQLSLVEGGLHGAWVLERDGDIVGRVNLNNVIRGVFCTASVGYWVDHAHLRRGLAVAAVEHGCAEALSMGLHRVEAGTMLANVASQQVLLRAGFEYYGTAPKMLFLAGDWQDHKLYQRLLHDNPPG